jgi:hypothetical protein
MPAYLGSGLPIVDLEAATNSLQEFRINFDIFVVLTSCASPKKKFSDDHLKVEIYLLEFTQLADLLTQSSKS